MTKRTILIILGFFLAAAGLLALSDRPVVAQDAQPTPVAGTPSDNDVNRVAKQMYCPVCENIPLDVCPTQACQEWRELIRQKLAQGWTDQQIKTYFAQQYGDRVLAEPPQRGLNWIVYVVPPVVFLIGVGIVWRVLASMRKRPASAGVEQGTRPPAPNADDPYLKKLEEELRKQEK